MRIVDFDGNDYPIMAVQCWAARLEEQNDRLRNRIAINRLCRAMYREARSKQNMRFASVETYGKGRDSAAMRGDPTDRRERLATWLFVAVILGLVAIALRDVM
jgi:hypothetical protein